MRFLDSTVECYKCGREISEGEDMRHPDADDSLCPGCQSRLYQEFIKSPCKLCGEPMGKGGEAMYQEDEAAHMACWEKLPDGDDKDEWYDGY